MPASVCEKKKPNWPGSYIPHQVCSHPGSDFIDTAWSLQLLSAISSHLHLPRVSQLVSQSVACVCALPRNHTSTASLWFSQSSAPFRTLSRANSPGISVPYLSGYSSISAPKWVRTYRLSCGHGPSIRAPTPRRPHWAPTRRLSRSRSRRDGCSQVPNSSPSRWPTWEHGRAGPCKPRPSPSSCFSSSSLQRTRGAPTRTAG